MSDVEGGQFEEKVNQLTYCISEIDYVYSMQRNWNGTVSEPTGSSWAEYFNFGA